MTPNTRDRELREALDELVTLREKATPGPWTTEYSGENWWIASCGVGEGDMTVWSPNSPTPDHGGEREDDGGEADRSNAAFIAAVGSFPFADLRAALNAVPPEPLDGLDVERLARALVALMPGYFAWPASGSEREGIPYTLNALYNAGQLAEQYAAEPPSANPNSGSEVCYPPVGFHGPNCTHAGTDR